MRDHDDVAFGVGHEPPDQRRLAGARLAGEEDVSAAAEQLQRLAELVGEDDAVGHPRHGAQVTAAADTCCAELTAG